MTSPNSKNGRARIVSVIIFVLGLCMLAGANSYKDFYTDLKGRYTGAQVDYEQIAEFCGWTGKQLPGESDAAYAFRSFWNMASAMLGMSVISVLAFGLVFFIIFLGFYLSGAFK